VTSSASHVGLGFGCILDILRSLSWLFSRVLCFRPKARGGETVRSLANKLGTSTQEVPRKGEDQMVYPTRGRVWTETRGV
jgi:hypothetical protein